MEMVYDLLKITLPAIIVLYAVYLMVRSFMQRQLDEYQQTLRHKNQEVVMPIRLQAYERICLLLERISPNNIIPRLNESGMTAKELQSMLVSEIRSEYNHNLSQQVYISDDAWSFVSGAVEQLISLINEAGNEVKADAASIELARLVLEKSMQNQSDTIKGAIHFLKGEIKELF
ncbi:hypothetical protein [Marinoscillum sp. MHG1-6]|uniref:DUF7935 family protein n=1 Tax=Marinoscillum sp. MHG1-6 TaxID=2959627 RepID=UPI0021589A8F|nr:hypothetical protein [Marinoscillum sp. MHG1-6]